MVRAGDILAQNSDKFDILDEPEYRSVVPLSRAAETSPKAKWHASNQVAVVARFESLAGLAPVCPFSSLYSVVPWPA